MVVKLKPYNMVTSLPFESILSNISKYKVDKSDSPVFYLHISVDPDPTFALSGSVLP